MSTNHTQLKETLAGSIYTMKNEDNFFTSFIKDFEEVGHLKLYMLLLKL